MTRLPLPRLAGYAAPALPLAMLTLPVYVVLPPHYAGTLGLGLGTVGAVLLLARLWDAVSDPLVGFLSDRIPTPFGRRRPWIALGLPVTLLGVWQLMLPPEGADAWHLGVWSAVLYTGWTLMVVPLTAWGAELSDDYHERTRISGAREGAVVLGTMAALALPAALGAGGAGEEGRTLAIIGWATVILLPLSLVSLMYAVPERPAEASPPIGFRRGVAVLAGNGPFRRLVAAYLLNGVANGLPATLFLPFVGQGLGAGGQAGILLSVYFACGVGAVPLWIGLSRRFGKHRTWSAAMVAACLAFAPVPLLGPGDFWPFLAICVFTGLMLGADLVLPTAMQADVVDIDRMRTGGARRTGLYFALWSLATKLSTALAVGLAFPLLEAVGFRTEGPNDATPLAVLALTYSALPIAFKLGAVALLWSYPLDEARQAAIRRRIERRAAAARPPDPPPDDGRPPPAPAPATP